MKLVLIRHGQSAWNLENKFTGWTDVDLTEKGVEEAKNGGKTLKDLGLEFDVAFTSYQKKSNQDFKLRTRRNRPTISSCI